MNVILAVDSFPPDISSAANYFQELGLAFTQRGHRVTVLTRVPPAWVRANDPRLKGKMLLRDEVDGLLVNRIHLFAPTSESIILRGLMQIQQFFLYIWAGLTSGKQDVLLIYSPRFLSGLTVATLAALKGIPFISNVQDIFPDCLVDLGKLTNPFMIRLANAIQAFVHHRARYITVHSEGNKDVLVRKGLDPAKIIVIPNWVDAEEIKPGERMNGFRAEHGLGSNFIVSFAGRMEFSQDVGTIIEAANHLRQRPEITFLMVGEGLEEPGAKKRTAELGLTNVVFLPLQPKEKYPQVLEASDVGLVTLRKSVITPVVPSKLLSIMSAGRAVITCLPLNGDAPKIVEEAQCGLCVEPEDPAALAQAILTLYEDEQLRCRFGENGRRHVQEQYSKDACINQYEQVLLSAAKRQ